MSRNGSVILVGAAGKIGKSLFESMKKIYDLKMHDIKPRTYNGKNPTEMIADPVECQGLPMHIAIPYTDDFEDVVEKYNETYNPKFIILHCSVKPGTTKSLFEKGLRVVHSPAYIFRTDVRTLGAWRKIVGYDDSVLGLEVLEHLNHCFTTLSVKDSIVSEVCELMLGLYAVSSMGFCQEIKRIVASYNIDYGAVRTFIDEFNKGNCILHKGNDYISNPAPGLISDERLEFMNLLPENLQSAFFKLVIKSNEMEKPLNEKTEQLKVQEQGRGNTGSQEELQVTGDSKGEG